jgi:hypothetical protein
MSYRDHGPCKPVDTERKYVQDLDLEKDIEQKGVIIGDAVHDISLNINAFSRDDTCDSMNVADNLDETLQGQYKEVINNGENSIVIEAVDGTNAFHAQAALMTTQYNAADNLVNLMGSVALGTDRDSKLCEIQTAVYEGLKFQDCDEHGCYRVLIRLHLDLLQFLEDEFGQGSNQALGSIITLTGSALYVQAATCAEYVQQNWPVFGVQILAILEAALKDINHYGSCMSFAFSPS